MCVNSECVRLMCICFVRFLDGLGLSFPSDGTVSLFQGTGGCAFSKWEPDSTKKEISLKNFVDTDIIKGDDKPVLVLSVATLKCPGLGSDLLCS